MARTWIEAAFLNIVATPHPKGTYKRILSKAAGRHVNFWGSEFAAISPRHRSDENGFINFVLLIWTEVDPKAPAIRKAQLEKEEFPREGREFAKTYGVNGKVFQCLFDTSNHLLTIEIRNDEGASISPSRLGRIFSALLSQEMLGGDEPDIQVTVLPREDALSYVLGFSRIDKVEMFLKIPNQDDVTADAHRIMEKLKAQNVKYERREMARQPRTAGINLNEENKTIAKVAAHNGYVKAAGINKDGENEKRSTKEVPKVVRRSVEVGASFIAILRQIAVDARKHQN